MFNTKQDAIVIKQAYPVSTNQRCRMISDTGACWGNPKPQKQEQKRVRHMRELKTEIKKLRFTKSEVAELDQYLAASDLTFSEFVSDLIKEKLHGNNAAIKKKTKKIEPPKADPAVLFQIGRIGNNLNQLAKSLNILRQDPSVSTFSFLECFHLLSQMQGDLHHWLGELPKIERSPEAVAKARERAIKRRA